MTTRRFGPTVLAIAFSSYLAGTGFAPALADSTSRTITVTGHGEAAGTPDTGHISAGVQTQAKTAAQALAQNAAAMNKVFAALKRMGIPDKDIQTSGFSVSPQYTQYSQTEAQKIVGYQVSNQVDVTIENVTKVGPAIDALVGAGANQMNSISFSIRDSDALMAKARGDAVDDAVARAQVLTKAAHVTLGPILSISESSAEPPRPVFMARMAKAEATPIAAGEQTLTADVSITWEIQ